MAAETTKKPAKNKATKPAPKTKAAPVAAGHATKPQWRKPRPGTMRARVLAAMIGESKTVAEIAAAAAIPQKRVLPHIYATWADTGIGYRVEGDKYVADLPAGETRETIFAAT
jgi:hypothetical protein